MSLSLQPVTEKQTSTTHAVVSPVAAQAAPARHIQSVDGLRGLACLAVVTCHCYFHASGFQWPLGLPRLLWRGYLGVEVFFVLSGFCLAYPMFSRADRPDDWKLYARKRAQRILPAYWAALLLFGLVSFGIHHYHVQPFASSGFLVLPSVRQFLYAFFLIGVWFNTSFWTLTVEARWYILFPFLMKIHRRFKGTGLLAVTCCVSLVYALIQRRSGGAKLDFLVGPLPLFLPLFALGINSAHWITRKDALAQRLLSPGLCRCGLLCSVVLTLLVIPADATETTSYTRIVLGGFLALFLLLTALRDPLGQRILAWKPLAGVGAISYSLYLIHYPLIELMAQITKPRHWSPLTQFCFYEGFMAALCIGCAYLFYQLAERPFLFQKQKG